MFLPNRIFVNFRYCVITIYFRRRLSLNFDISFFIKILFCVKAYSASSYALISWTLTWMFNKSIQEDLNKIVDEMWIDRKIVLIEDLNTRVGKRDEHHILSNLHLKNKVLSINYWIHAHILCYYVLNNLLKIPYFING